LTAINWKHDSRHCFGYSRLTYINNSLSILMIRINFLYLLLTGGIPNALPILYPTLTACLPFPYLIGYLVVVFTLYLPYPSFTFFLPNR